jgi:hypothetical protein
MKSIAQLENRASRRRSKHEGESSTALCDRHSRTRDFSQRQLPTDQDYAVPTREYQTDQSSLKPAPTAAGPVLDQRQKQRQRQKQPHRRAEVDRVTPYQSSFKIAIVLAARPKPELRQDWTVINSPLRGFDDRPACFTDLRVLQPIGKPARFFFLCPIGSLFCLPWPVASISLMLLPASQT